MEETQKENYLDKHP